MVSPFLGKVYSTQEIESSIEEHSNWLTDVSHEIIENVNETALKEIARNELIQCYERIKANLRDEDERISEDEDMDEAVSMIVRSALLLSRGALIGWFQGRAEFGPRALGARSLLADPRNGQ